MKMMFIPFYDSIRPVNLEDISTVTVFQRSAVEKHITGDEEPHPEMKERIEKEVEKIMESGNKTFRSAETIIWLKNSGMPSVLTRFILCDWTLDKFYEELRLASNPNLIKRKRAFLDNGMSVKFSDIKEVEEVDQVVTVKKIRVTLANGKELFLDVKPEVKEVIENKDE